jgi:hypothetical protein
MLILWSGSLAHCRTFLLATHLSGPRRLRSGGSGTILRLYGSFDRASPPRCNSYDGPTRGPASPPRPLPLPTAGRKEQDMPFLGSVFDPTTLTLMYRALDAAWVEYAVCARTPRDQAAYDKAHHVGGRSWRDQSRAVENPRLVPSTQVRSRLSPSRQNNSLEPTLVVGRFAAGSRFPNVPLGSAPPGQGTLLADALIKRRTPN